MSAASSLKAGGRKTAHRNLAPFLSFDEALLKEMIPEGAVHTYRSGCVIIHEGDTTDSLYVILSGRVKVYISDENGKEFMLGAIEPGDYFGEIALDGGSRTASIMTTEKCRLFVVPSARVRTLIERHPDFSHDLIGRLLRKIRSLADSVHNLALMNVYCRIIKFLDEHATAREDGCIATERVTQQEIAACVGASREMVSRTLADLANCGYITIENKRIIVLKKLPGH